MRIAKTMFDYAVLYNDDLRLDGKAVRTLWPQDEDVFPEWFLTQIKSKGWDYEVSWAGPTGIHCIDLI